MGERTQHHTARDLGFLILKGMRWSKYLEMSPLVSMLFWTFLNPLKFLMDIFNKLCQFVSFLDAILMR